MRPVCLLLATLLLLSIGACDTAGPDGPNDGNPSDGNDRAALIQKPAQV